MIKKSNVNSDVQSRFLKMVIFYYRVGIPENKCPLDVVPPLTLLYIHNVHIQYIYIYTYIRIYIYICTRNMESHIVPRVSFGKQLVGFMFSKTFGESS